MAPQSRSASRKPRQSSSDAETLVAEALARAGWAILGRNRRHVGYELDVIARKGQTLAVVEVKARKYAPKTATDMQCLLPPRKIAALTRGANALVGVYGASIRTVRIDLAVVYPDGKGRLHIAYFVGTG